MRIVVLTVLLLALALQSGMQLMSNLQLHRHLHTQSGAAAAVPSQGIQQEWRARLPLLMPFVDLLRPSHQQGFVSASLLGMAEYKAPHGLHAHGALVHRHDEHNQDAVALDPQAGDPLPAGATPFLGWLPQPQRFGAGGCDGTPAALAFAWQDQVVAPPRVPPRG